MIGYLICEDGPLTEWVFAFDEGESWIIGRDEDSCDFVLEDPMISRKHLAVSKKGDSYYIENLSSTNPILLNDNQIDESTEVKEDDLIQIGNNIFRFSFSKKEGANQFTKMSSDDEDNDEALSPSAPSPSKEEPFFFYGDLSL